MHVCMYVCMYGMVCVVILVFVFNCVGRAGLWAGEVWVSIRVVWVVALVFAFKYSRAGFWAGIVSVR